MAVSGSNASSAARVVVATNDVAAQGIGRGLIADSRTVAAWTLVSRVTGFARVVMVASVLGPTYFGNLFQSVVVLPAVLYAVMGGSLINAMLVPRLVRWNDARDEASFHRLANNFLGVLMVILGLIVIASLACAPLLLNLATVAVPDPAIRAQQRHVGLLLLPLVLPELVLYAIVAVGIAVQNARGHFALAAGAPATENLMNIAVLGASACVFGTGRDAGDITIPNIMLLGIGTTLSLAFHAGVQWYGAYRRGVVLFPRLGWRDSEIRHMLGFAFSSSTYTTLYNLVLMAAVVIAGRLPGGSIAFLTGFNFSILPVALSAFPLASAQLPRLARNFNEHDVAAFAETFERSVGLARFVALPAGLLLLTFSGPVAHAMAFGSMASQHGIAMLTACIGGLGAGVFGEAQIVVATSASYARLDARTPLRAQILRCALALSGMGLAICLTTDIALLWAIGISVSLANILCAVYLRHRIAQVPRTFWWRRARSFGSEILANIFAFTPCIPILVWGQDYAVPRYQQIALLLVVMLACLSTYLTLQWLRKSKELAALLQEIGWLRAKKVD